MKLIHVGTPFIVYAYLAIYAYNGITYDWRVGVLCMCGVCVVCCVLGFCLGPAVIIHATIDLFPQGSS